MNLAAPVTVLAVVFAFASSVAAQGGRGFAAGGGSSAGSGQSGTTGSPGHGGTSGSGTHMTTPRPGVTAAPPGVAPGPGFMQAPGVPIQSTPRAAVPQFVPPVVHGGSAPAIAPRDSSSLTTITTAPAPGVAPAPKGQYPRTSPGGTPRVAPPVVSGGGFATTPANPSRRPPGGGIESGRPPHRPPRPPRPPYFHYYRYYRHPGIIIFGSPYYPYAPYYYYPYPVITEMAPGVLQEERRYADEPPPESRSRSSDQLAPFDPTPAEVVDRMLWLAGVKAGDLLYDLGAGDGRVAIAAAKKYGIKAVGFEIDPGLVKLARENVRKQKVEHLVEIRQEDILTADMSLPSVVTLYLSYEGNLAVRPRLMSQLKRGARVVSYAFDMAEWQPKVAESYRDAAGLSHMIYLWEIGGPLVFGEVRP